MIDLLRTFNFVKILETKSEKTPPYNAWESVKDDAEDGHYERVVPAHFAADCNVIFVPQKEEKYAVGERGDGDDRSIVFPNFG